LLLAFDASSINTCLRRAKNKILRQYYWFSTYHNYHD